MKYLLMIPFFLFTFLQVKSQGIKISGVVTDQNGDGLPGVTVMEKNTVNGVITDIDGIYVLTLTNDQSVLRFTYVGFVSQEITVGNKTTINVSMSEDFSELEEVVVIGYGIQKKKVITGSIVSVSSEEISKTPIARIDQALQGRASGVQVLNQSGQPGEQGGVKIRGIGTDYNAEPLYLVDGITVQSIDNLNPGDVASMEILKDAASASIYGARAANGVVLITTKTGSNDTHSITYSGYVGVQNAAKKVDVLNAEQYQQLMAEAEADNLFGEPFDANEIPQNNTDWQEKLFTDNASIENHEISVIGGNKKTKFASSISYFKQNGIIGDDKSQFQRYTGRLNTNTEVKDWLTWGNTLSFAHITTRGVVSNGSFNGEYSSALNLDPLTPVYENNAEVLNLPPYGSNPYVVDEEGRAFAISSNVGGELVNPLARLSIQNQVVDRDQILGSLFAEVKPIEGLKLKSSLSLDLSFLEINSYNPLFFLNGTTSNVARTSLSKQFQKKAVIQNEQILNYTYKLNKHNFNFLLGTTYVQDDWESLAGGGQDIDTSNPDLRFLNLTTDSTQTVGGIASEYRLFSLFSRLLYDYNERISFSGTYRKDGSSNFGKNNRFGTFWSFGASWIINEEPFFPQSNFISFLKLRISWGQNGNDRIRPFSFASVIDFNPAYNFQNGTQTAAIPAYLADEDIKWETAEQLDIGIESGFFENKLTISLDYYKETTKDLLQPSLGLASLGISLNFANAGTMENEGFEFAVDWRDNLGELKYSLGINGAYNRNTMVKVANESGILSGASWALAGEVSRTVEEFNVTSFYGFKTTGIFQSEADVFSYLTNEGTLIQPGAKPGDIRFVDVNRDGIISDEDKTIIGSPIPDWVLGSTISLAYKNFNLYALFTSQLGNEIFNGINRPDISTSNRQSWILDRWTPENPTTTIPRFTISDPNQNYKRATDLLNIENGSYLRLKNIQFGYNLPQSITNKFKCTSWNIYLSAENLITITGYSGSDPEVGSPVDFFGSGVSSIRDMGIDRGIYPQARTFRLGTSITF